MARIRTGPVVADLTGSVGGTTFQRGPSGLVMRTRGARIGGRWGFSAGRQKEFSEVLAFWRGMSEEDRRSWGLWAAKHIFIDALGQSCRGTGRRAFVSLGMVISCLGGDLVSRVPTYGLTTQLSVVSLTAALGGAGVQIAFTPSPVEFWEVPIAWGCVYRSEASTVPSGGWRGPWGFGIDKTSPLDATACFTSAFGTLAAGMRLGVRLTVGNMGALCLSSPLTASCLVTV